MTKYAPTWTYQIARGEGTNAAADPGDAHLLMNIMENYVVYDKTTSVRE